MINLRDHKVWDSINGTLSVSMPPQVNAGDSGLHVLLNGNSGNFCLDYTPDDFNEKLAKQRAWSTDTGYYIKITPEDKVIITRWWDRYLEEVPLKLIAEKPKQFYNVIYNDNPKSTESIIAFSKQVFINLRNCIAQRDNGLTSLRTFMYLLAALEDNVQTGAEVDPKKWLLHEFDNNWIAPHNWEFVYNAFNSGLNEIQPVVRLVLRHASNRLFQEAHREATREYYQPDLWGGTNRNYDSPVSQGAYYTPTPLVRTIVQESLWALNKAKPLNERESIKILDPACGSAEFLREVLRQLKLNYYNGKIEITGWDISEIACEMSRFVLNYENLTEWNGNIKINISNRNSLEYDWQQGGKQDVVLLNPPFKSYENQGDKKEIILEQLKGFAKRQPDMAAVFWKKASEVTAPIGVTGIVIPHSLLSADTYKELRNYIKEELKIDFSLMAHIGSAGLFEKAMIIPSVLVGTKEAISKTNTVLWTNYEQKSVYKAFRELRIYRNKDIALPVSYKSFSIYNDEQLSEKEKWSVNSYKLNRLEKRLDSFSKVGDLFNVSRGADTGNNVAFLLKKEEWLKLPKKEQKYFRPCIMRGSIKNGILNDSFYIFFPYDKMTIENEEELLDKLPVYFKSKLSSQTERLKRRKGFKGKWWMLSRPRDFHEKTKLVSAYFGKSGYFAFNSDGMYVVGQSFAWLPKKTELESEEFSFAYLALLHAPLINKLLEMVCNVLDGGYYDLSKHYVERMPLPDLTKANVELVKDLIELGINIHLGKPVDAEKLNNIAALSYGVDIEELNFD